MTTQSPAARLAAALEEKAETSNPVEKIVKVSEADDSSAASDIKSILIHEGMMTND